MPQRFDRTYEELKLHHRQKCGFANGFGFWSYLWGIETFAVCLKGCLHPLVLIVPMRNWNISATATVQVHERVLIVPMRNWNYICLTEAQRRTVEFWSYLWGIETWYQISVYPSVVQVLIVPMRNWNFSLAIQPPRSPALFWSYLWGIETSGVAWINMHIFRMVLIVPMRNWNNIASRLSVVAYRVLIVPMRNWNSAQSLERYERCQRVLIVPMRNWNMQYTGLKDKNGKFWSYLWGIETIQSIGQPHRSRSRFWSYLWGIETLTWRYWSGDAQIVLIVPMRNWNFVPRLSSVATGKVLIVPMRNWNIQRTSVRIWPASFWSYLWGIETRSFSSVRCDATK